jgi:hypothetical protein
MRRDHSKQARTIARASRNAASLTSWILLSRHQALSAQSVEARQRAGRQSPGIPGFSGNGFIRRHGKSRHRLAEEEELSSNPLSLRFQVVSITYNLMY